MTDFKPTKPIFNIVSKDEKDANGFNKSFGKMYINESKSGKKYFSLKMQETLHGTESCYLNIVDRGLQVVIMDYINNHPEVTEINKSNDSPAANNEVDLRAERENDAARDNPNYDRYGNIIHNQ